MGLQRVGHHWATFTSLSFLLPTQSVTLVIRFLSPTLYWNNSLLFSCLVVSNSLWPHGLQHARNMSDHVIPLLRILIVLHFTHSKSQFPITCPCFHLLFPLHYHQTVGIFAPPKTCWVSFCHRALAWAVSTTCILPLGSHLSHFFTAFLSLLKCHLITEGALTVPMNVAKCPILLALPRPFTMIYFFCSP